jgi:hypothetical protein
VAVCRSVGLFRSIKDWADDEDGDAPAPLALEPIAGVSLEMYAEVVRRTAGRGQDLGAVLADIGSGGVTGAQWRLAAPLWAARIRTDHLTAEAFEQLCAD